MLLDSSTIDKIAAGEVVERPSSVVKELVENAMDAGARAVTVEIKEGGCSFIRVTDNGGGIEKEQVRKAFFRHATSKIRTVEDLYQVKSLGFRGEALSSIAAVSMVELITKTRDELTGIHYRLEGEKEREFSEVGAPEGTTIIVRELFFNTPVRKKFLKSYATEGSYISDLMEHMALSRPEVAFQFMMNGQVRFHTSGNGDIREILYRIYGREIIKELIPFSAQAEGLQIEGFLGSPSVVRSNRNFEFFFVNGRYIKSPLLSKGLEAGYKAYLMQHKFPFALLHFTIDPDRIDVNVHPSKMEIRFHDQPGLYAFLEEKVREALRRREMIPDVTLEDRKETKKGPDKGAANKEGLDKEILNKETLSNETPNKEAASAYVPRLMRPVAEQPSTVNSESPQNPTEAEAAAMPVAAPALHAAEKQPEAVIQAEIKNPAPEVPETSFQPEQTEEPSLSSLPAPVQPENEEKAEVAVHSENQEEAEASVQSEAHESSPAPFVRIKPEAPQPFETRRLSQMLREEEGLYQVQDVKQMELFEEKLLTKEAVQSFRILGQVFDTYWLAQYEDKLLFIDQHAAHEKVKYEALINKMKTGTVDSQMLTPPIVLNLSAREAHLLERYESYFAQMGFEIDEFGGNAYTVRSVPCDLYGHYEKEFIEAILDELEEEPPHGTPSVIAEKLASMACKSAVKGNHTMSFREMEALLDQLLKLENPYHCPHGRPTIITMSKYELEKKFKRII